MATISYATAGPSRLTSMAPTLFSRTLPSLILRSSASGTSKAQQSISSVDHCTTSLPTAGTGGTHLIRGLIDSLVELFPPFLLAVPKKKVSHSRKSMRSAHKGLKNKTNISLCPGCGAPKLSHNLCPECFSQINRRWKQEARQAGTGPEIPA